MSVELYILNSRLRRYDAVLLVAQITNRSNGATLLAELPIGIELDTVEELTGVLVPDEEGEELECVIASLDVIGYWRSPDRARLIVNHGYVPPPDEPEEANERAAA